MIVGYRVGPAGVESGPLDFARPVSEQPLWIDVCAPTAAERMALERLLGLRLPEPDSMLEIEPTSRLYYDGDAVVMTALVPERAELEHSGIVPLAFVHVDRRLVTVRYGPAAPVDLFAERLSGESHRDWDHDTVFLGLLDAAIDRVADGLEQAAAHLDALSLDIFNGGRIGARQDYRAIIGRIGDSVDAAGRARESLFTLDRLVSFFNVAAVSRSGERRGRTRPLSRDVQSLASHAGFLADKGAFLLDATLGMVGIEQNAIIKIFSVMAVIFLPPTLIASIYGMNFEFMPELSWPFGYPLALLLMVASAILPYQWFKIRGWL